MREKTKLMIMAAKSWMRDAGSDLALSSRLEVENLRKAVISQFNLAPGTSTGGLSNDAKLKERLQLHGRTPKIFLRQTARQAVTKGSGAHNMVCD